jgi:hypothetical protein
MFDAAGSFGTARSRSCFRRAISAQGYLAHAKQGFIARNKKRLSGGHTQNNQACGG